MTTDRMDKTEEKKPVGAIAQLFRNPELRQVLPGLAVSAFLSNLLALALPLSILQILDRVILNQALSTLTFLALGLVIALLLEQALRLANSVITNWLTARQEYQLTMQVTQHLFQVPLRDYEREEPSAYAEKLRDASRVARFHSGEAILALLDLPFVLLFLILVGLIGGTLVAYPLLVILLFMLVMTRYGRDGGQLSAGQVGQEDRRSGFLVEVFSGIHSIKAMMMENLMLRRYERLQRATSEVSERSLDLDSRIDRVGHYFSQLMVVGIIFFGSWFVMRGEMTPGGLAACLILSMRLMRPLRRTLSVRNQVNAFEQASARLQTLLDLPAMDNANKPPLPPIMQGLELRDVRLQYRDKPLFEHLDLRLPKGTCMAIQSDSGTGKTALLNLLCGAEQPDGGEVLVDGQPLSQFDSSTLHARIGLLPQSAQLISGTILENLTMFDEALNDKALSIARELGLDHFVAGMKFGYETRLGETANEAVSGGARQLIGIVRALVHEPDVILFDEANVFLDMDTDQTVRRYLENNRQQRTIVMVTHRPSYLILADQIYHFDNGALIEGAPPAIEWPQESLEVAPRPEPASDPALIMQQRFHEHTDLSHCLLPLLNALGWHGRLRELAESLPHFDARIDLSSFFSALVQLGYRPAAIGRLRQAPDDRLLPCLLLPNDAHGCVLLGRDADGLLRVLDGATGVETQVESVAQRGDYYTFMAEAEATRGEVDERQWISAIANRFKRHRFIILVATLLTTVLSLAPPLFVRATWDAVIPVGDFSVAISMVVGVLIAVLLGWVLSRARGRLLAFIGGRADYLLGVNLTQQLLGLPAAALDKVPVARQVRRIRGLVRLREYFIGPLALLTFDLPATSILVLVLILINPWMSVLLLVSVVAFVLAAMVAINRSRSLLAKTSKRMASRTEFLDEMLASMRVIRQTGSQRTWFERLRALSAGAVFGGSQESRSNQYVRVMGQVIANLTGVGALVTSAWLAIRGDITNGTLIATQILTWRITGPMQNVFVAATAATRIKENVKQLEGLMRLPTEDARGVRQTLRPESPGAFDVSRVSFRYSNDVDPSLLGVNFRIEPKQFVAITGSSGSGKSTLLKLFLGLYAPQAGSILLDGVDIRQLTAADLRSRISYMPQNCDIYYGTLAQNLMLVHPAATREEVVWAAEMAGVLSDAFADGLETRISGSRMNELPGGFRQRLSLARVMLKPAPIVLMDEPGTGMDNKGEAALLRCLQWLRGRATLIVVTVRPGHLRLADVVVSMRHARVESIGPYQAQQRQTQQRGRKSGKRS
ncbi:MAG: ATP-binding cassette domain-containing protein [Lamprobacter sp.]|uniref:peptidase domain-containing ABC transporter n=1 Tax=Lamprobacter sp. TaxID=3100796 RepID=UPI002B25CDE2|nr:ATP-binding cassette domain-containing protein [Lamprobacter sp.]MEA3642056.1 ATP-binding cassette domain-containing protein [Lamprobacter sp.]